jgi:hypothetical protein
MTVWEIMTGKELWEHYTADQVAHRTVNYHELPPIPDCNPLIQKLLGLCWQKLPTLRPDFSQICEMLNVTKEDEDGIEEIELTETKKNYVANNYGRVGDLVSEFIEDFYLE